MKLVDEAWKQLPREAEGEVPVSINIINRWDLALAKGKFIFDGYHKLESDQYLVAVDEIQRLTDSAFGVSKRVLKMAMNRLGYEYGNILALIIIKSTELVPQRNTTNASYMSSVTDTSSSCGFHEEDYMDTDPTLNIQLVSYLHNITKRMNSSGYLHQCVHLYTGARKEYLNYRFRRLWIQKLSICDVLYLDLDQIEKKTKEWIRAAKACFRVLLVYEKQLCDQTFGRGSTTSDDCFIETVKDVVNELFVFAEEANKFGESIKKIFVILDIYNAFSEIIPYVNVLFHSKRSKSIRIRADQILPKLQEAVRAMLQKFEEDVLHEQSPIPPVGHLHYFPVYVMNYIQRLSQYQQPLMEVITSMALPSLPQTTLVEHIVEETPLSLHLIWITMTLVLNLGRKAKLYDDTLSGHLFLVNHLYYIVYQIAFTQQLRGLIGDLYQKTLIEEFQHNQDEYLGLALKKILNCLRNEELQVMGCFPFGVSNRSLKQRLMAFNATFEEVQHILAKSATTDGIQKCNLQESIVELIPAYTSFLQQFRRHIKIVEHQKYIKYSADDLQNAVREFLPEMVRDRCDDSKQNAGPLAN